MNSPIQKFSIIGLFGYKNIDITFKENVMIVIGENGFGKTSILNALTFTIQGKWKKLLSIRFDQIKIKINNQEFEFSHKILSDYCEYLDRRKDDDVNDITDFVKNNIGDEKFSLLSKMVFEGNKKGLHDMVKNTPFLQNIPENYLYNSVFTSLNREKLYGLFTRIIDHVKELNCDILYLPTYRRVEVDLGSLQIPNRKHTPYMTQDDEYISTNYWNNAVIRFGMEDVQDKIIAITKTISQSFLAGYAEASGDMIRQLLKDNSMEQHKLTCDTKQMRIVLARIGNNLTMEEKNNILSMVEGKSKELQNKPYLVYFLEQLLAVYKKQERFDTAIKNFCSVCNKYLNEKAFYFDESNVSLKIYRKISDELLINEPNEVKLSQLSSGEKQIVSIFAQVYLNVDRNYIVLLDEPELSLSIFWQENLIPDLIASNKCDFIMAVTHSPFIFGQKLKKYTVGINEFLSKRL